MMRQFCGSIDECCFDLTGRCVQCGRKEPKPVRSFDEDEDVKEPNQEESDI